MAGKAGKRVRDDRAPGQQAILLGDVSARAQSASCRDDDRGNSRFGQVGSGHFEFASRWMLIAKEQADVTTSNGCMENVLATRPELATLLEKSEPCLWRAAQTAATGHSQDWRVERGAGSEAAFGAGQADAPARADRQPPAARREHVYAALDLGTNNCRLLVARPTGNTFRVIDAFSRIVRLGEGLAATGRLNGNAMNRAVDALAVCAQKMRDRRVDRARLIATEACRAAENGEAFIARVLRETGLDLEIVDRETEARLAAAGCVPLIDRTTEGVVLFDIGGGSSELVWLGFEMQGGQRVPTLRGWISLPVGVVTLSERHGGVSVTPEGFEAMVDDVAAMAVRVRAQAGHRGRGRQSAYARERPVPSPPWRASICACRVTTGAASTVSGCRTARSTASSASCLP